MHQQRNGIRIAKFLGLIAGTTLIFGTVSGAHAGSVVILGDSLSVGEGVGLGNRLDRELRAAGHQITTVASCGSSPSSYRDDAAAYSTRCGYLKRGPSGAEEYLPWEKIKGTGGKRTPKLSEIFGASTPDLAVIQQGTNLYGFMLGNPSQGRELVAKQVSSLLLSSSFRAKACLWVGPPKIARYDGKTVSDTQMQAMNQAIQLGLDRAEKAGKKCRLMDSLPLTERPGGDGIHHMRGSQTDQWVAGAKQASLDILSGASTPAVASGQECQECAMKGALPSSGSALRQIEEIREGIERKSR